MYDSTVPIALSDNGALAGGLMAFTGVMAIVMIIVPLITIAISYVVYALILSRLFKKAGVKTSIAWIPFYNQWKFLEIGDQKGFWIFVPIASIIFQYIAMYNIGKKLGKEDWFIALAIFFPYVWFPLVAFDKSVWNGAEASVANQMPTAPPNATVPENNNPNIHPAAQASMAQPVAPIIAPVQTENITPEAPAPTIATEQAYAAPETPAPMTEAQIEVPSVITEPLEAVEPVYTVPETLTPLEQPYVEPGTPTPVAEPEIPIAPEYNGPQTPEAPSGPIDPNIQ